MSNHFRRQYLAMFGAVSEAEFQAEFARRNFALFQRAVADPRLPRDAIGYIADLQAPTAAWPVVRDRIMQIRRHLPEFAPWGE